MNRFGILGPKTSNLPHFGHKKNFPRKMGSLTFMFLLNQKIKKKKVMSQFRETGVKDGHKN